MEDIGVVGKIRAERDELFECCVLFVPYMSLSSSSRSGNKISSDSLSPVSPNFLLFSCVLHIWMRWFFSLSLMCRCSSYRRP